MTDNSKYISLLKAQKNIEPKRLSFLRMVELSDDGCWLWTGHKHFLGYGLLCRGAKVWKAHRWGWTLFNGTIPNGMMVLHKCDVRNCVNPDHLFLGNATDNMRDMAAKGRGVYPDVRGEKNGMAKLTLDKVKQIRKIYAINKEPMSSLAKKFGVSPMAISRVINFQLWK